MVNKPFFILIAIVIAGLAFGVSAFNTILNNPSGTPPVGWWKMDEDPAIHNSTIRDYSVNGNTGTLSTGDGATNKSVDGKIGKALSFDGTNDYVDAGNASSLQITNNISIEVWFKTPSSFTTNPSLTILQTYLGKYLTTGNQRSWTSGLAPQSAGGASNRLAIQLGDPADGTYEYGGYYDSALAISTWYHAVWTFASGTLTLFLNGSSVAITTYFGAVPASLWNSTDNLYIGAAVGGTSNFWTSSIDDVRIYNYARTADQIAADYRAGAYRTIVGSSVPSNWWTDGLVGYWNFDGKNTTSTAGTRDVSNNGNWGVFNGTIRVAGGASGQAIRFDGDNDYVDVGFKSSLQNMTSRSVFLWFKTEGGIEAGGPLWYQSRCYSTGGDDAGVTTTTVEIRLSKTGDCTTVSESFGYTQGEWTFVGYAWDGSTVRYYKNGVEVGTPDSLSGITLYGSGYNLMIGSGRRNVASPNSFYGLIDEFRIYNRGLSADEVKQHYEQTRRNITL